jgi:4-hydroxy-3-polyprenylbenzoate decarboxylase
VSKYIIGITGASGSIYSLRLLEVLLKQGHEVHLVATHNGQKVFNFETGKAISKDAFEPFDKYSGTLNLHDVDDLFAPISSGSFKTDGMVVIPCSMSTLGEICAGASKNLLGRAADVCIKEKRKLVLVPRETPLSSIHLRNMLTLSELGVIILPAMPGFYHKPKTLEDMVNFVVSRVLDCLGIENDLYEKWR